MKHMKHIGTEGSNAVYHHYCFVEYHKQQKKELADTEDCGRCPKCKIPTFLHAPSVHAGSEHVVVIYHTCIQHVSNIYQSYNTCITYMYHACISAYQGGFGHRVSRMYQCVSEALPKSVCIVCVSARITCIRNGVYLDTCIIHVSVCIRVYHTLCITQCIKCVVYRMYPVYIVNLYHNGWKCQKMRIFF